MKFKAHIDYGDGYIGEEDYTADEIHSEDDAKRHVQGYIDHYNKTHPGYKPRSLVRVELPGGTASSHRWGKVNIVTQIGKIQYDTYECSECGISGNRYTLGGPVERHHAFKADVFDRCDTAKAEMARRRR